MQHIFIINPTAGKSDSREKIYAMAESLRQNHGLDVKCMLTQSPGHATELTRSIAEKGEAVRFYACGGDGTVSEVVNGIAGFANAEMTCIPVGTGNDFLKNFGTDAALYGDAENLWDQPSRELDLIDCNGRLGIDMVCSGIDARIGAGVHKYKKVASGIWAYCLSLVENVLLRGLTRPMTVKMEDICWDGETTIICICNGRHYGGGFMPVPDAMPDDGVLDMLLIPKISLLTFARLVGKYAKGKYKDYPDLIWARHGEGVTFTTSGDNVTVVDGEVIPGSEFTVRIADRKINFFYPAYADYGVKEGTVISTPTATL